MSEQKEFPCYKKHADVVCFSCGCRLRGKRPLFYGFGRGAYAQWCSACAMHTFYDTNDDTFQFDEIGNPIGLTEGFTWKHNAPYNVEFLGAQPAKAGEDY